jgi:hypothetical protein
MFSVFNVLIWIVASLSPWTTRRTSPFNRSCTGSIHGYVFFNLPRCRRRYLADNRRYRYSRQYSKWKIFGPYWLPHWPLTSVAVCGGIRQAEILTVKGKKNIQLFDLARQWTLYLIQKGCTSISFQISETAPGWIIHKDCKFMTHIFVIRPLGASKERLYGCRPCWACL